MRRKPELPWRKHKDIQEKKEAAVLWRRLWKSRVAWSVAGAIITFMLLHANEAMENLRRIPSETAQTIHAFQSWYFDDELWTQIWSSREEGDIQDYGVSKVPIKLSMDAKRGAISGELYLATVCDRNPLLLPVLVEGEVTWRGKVFVKAFSYVGGQKRNLVSFTVSRSKDQPSVVTLEPLSDPSAFLPKSARLQSRINEADQREHEDLACKNDPIKFLRRMQSRSPEKAAQ